MFRNFKLKNKRNFYIVSSFVVILTGVTTCSGFKILRQNQSSYQPFITAKYQLHKGEILTIQNTKIVFLDLGQAKTHYVTHREFEEFDGLYLNHDIEVNCPILKLDLIENQDVQNQIPSGKRLFVLDASVGPILSLLKVGDIIDVIAQIDMPELGAVTETVLEAVQIASIGDPNNTHTSNNENQYLSFYLTPDEVKIISFMKPYSNFSVVLRNSFDTVSEKNQPVTLNRFLQNEKIKKIVESESFKIINGLNIGRKN